MACLSPSQHLFDSFIVDFDDTDPVLHSDNNNNKQPIKNAHKDPSIPPPISDDRKKVQPGDNDADSKSERGRAALGMTLSPSLVLPHTALSSPSDTASPLSPPNSESPSSSNASPAVPPLSLDNSSQSPSSPPVKSAGSPSPPASVKSEQIPTGLNSNSAMEIPPGQQPSGTGRIPPDFSRNQPAGKGGCWTCRIRRKKCDEIRVGDSCSTCIRLNIECLGWGPKRPAWMRDKQAVERYKAGIKEKLIKEGKVRGQPRPQPSQHTSTVSTPQRQLSGPSMARSGGSPMSYPGAGPSFVAGGPGPTSSTSAQAQHAHGQRYGPYPSPNTFGHAQLHPHLQTQLQAQQHTPSAPMMYSSSPSTPSSTLSTLAGGGGMDYFALETQQLPGHQGPMRRATVSVPVSRHLHSHHQAQERIFEQRRRAYQESALHLQHQPSGGSPHGQSQGTSHVYGGSANEQAFSSLDFSGPMLGGMGGSMSSMGGSMSSVSSSSSLNVPSMNVTGTFTSAGLTSSPLMLPTDDSIYASGYAAAQHFQHGNRPSRSGSGSTSSGTPSSSSHLQLTSGMPHSGHTVVAPPFTDALMDQSLVEPHIQYHFENVLPMQYVFSSEKAHGILQSLIARDPFGPLTNSSCALAALHNKAVRVAQGFDQPDSTTANQFFDRAYWQLVNASARASSMHSTASASMGRSNVGYSEADALAAIHLTGFFLLKDGSGDWSTHLDTAREWLLQTDLTADGNQNPKVTFARMSEAEKLAVKMVIWYDIFAAISLYQSPRFLTLYGRLLSRGSNDISGNVGSSTTDPISSIRMDLLMGCPDELLLILAETADLAHWKRQERQNGTLSTRELLRKGEAIETMLHEYNSAASAMQIQHMRPPRPSGEHNAPSLDMLAQTERMSVVEPATVAAGASGSASALSRSASVHATPAPRMMPLPTESASALSADPSISASTSPALLGLNIPSISAGPSTSPSMIGNSPALPSNQESNLPGVNVLPDIKQQVSIIFFETAGLFLQSVINDPSPGVPEVKRSMDRLFAALQALPTTIDRALVLPFTLAGCLTNNQAQGQYIRSRLSGQDETFGNIRATRLLIERVWQTREQNGVIDWRDVMRDHLGIELLLV